MIEQNRKLLERFPFLIGRIRTWAQWEYTSLKEIMFPFLIGRIRTENSNRATIDGAKFPFLIGRIRTGRYYPLIEKTGRLVSIPHR